MPRHGEFDVFASLSRALVIVYVLGFWLYGCFCKPLRALVIFYVLVLWLFVFLGVLLSLDKFVFWSFGFLVSAGILAQA